MTLSAVDSPTASAKMIVIQPGHGGSDPGAIGYGDLYESDINLSIALKLNSLLKQHGFQTIMTRTADVDQDPDQNMDLANAQEADAFIDIHNNGSENPDDSGDELWYVNKSEADQKMAKLMHAAVIKAIRGYGYEDVVDPGITEADPADEWMIERAAMPAVIIEGLYTTNPTEATLLKTDAFQETLARGIYNGLAGYFGSQDTVAVQKHISTVKKISAATLTAKKPKTSAVGFTAWVSTWFQKIAGFFSFRQGGPYRISALARAPSLSGVPSRPAMC